MPYLGGYHRIGNIHRFTSFYAEGIKNINLLLEIKFLFYNVRVYGTICFFGKDQCNRLLISGIPGSLNTTKIDSTMLSHLLSDSKSQMKLPFCRPQIVKYWQFYMDPTNESSIDRMYIEIHKAMFSVISSQNCIFSSVVRRY